MIERRISYSFHAGLVEQRMRLVTFSAGGSRDLVARLIAQGMEDAFREAVAVDHQPEIRGAVELVAHASPDGRTLLVLGPSFWITPFLQEVEYDPVRDFVPVTLAATQPNLLVVHPSLAVNSVAELIAKARNQPGQFRYATGMPGAPSHLAAKLFMYRAGIHMVARAYENTARLAVSDLIAGNVEMMIFSAGSAMPHVKAGRLKALAVTSAASSALVPGLPAVAATLPGYEAAQPIGVYAPAGTPAGIIQHLNREIVRSLTTSKAKQQLLDAGMEVVASSPEQLVATLKSEIAVTREIIEQTGIKAGSSNV